jgi:hypothetical protein
MIYCTSICSNYIPKAKVLARSIKRFDPNAIVVICLTEKEIPDFAKDIQYFDRIVLAKDIYRGDFNQFMFEHSIVEASTSVKGFLFQYLFKEFSNSRKFVYLDPDVEVFAPLEELERALDNHSIVLAPHMLDFETELDAILDNEINSMQYGVFNLGFLAVRNDDIGTKFIDWWAERLRVLCFDHVPSGIFTDQRWIDLAPGFFDVFILRHPGYDVAPWNLSKREIKKVNDVYEVNGEKLRFFHFSSIDKKAHLDMVNKYVPDKQNAVYLVWNNYISQLKEMGQLEYGQYPWSYGFYDNGKKISNNSRLMYVIDPKLKKEFPNPFSSSDLLISKKFDRFNSERIGVLMLDKLGLTFFDRILIKLEKSKTGGNFYKMYWKLRFVICTPRKFIKKYFPRFAKYFSAE